MQNEPVRKGITEQFQEFFRTVVQVFSITACALVMLFTSACKKEAQPTKEEQEISQLQQKIFLEHAERDPSGGWITLLAAKHSLTAQQVKTAVDIYGGRQASRRVLMIYEAKTLDELKLLEANVSNEALEVKIRQFAADESVPVEKVASVIFDYVLIYNLYNISERK